ncbi:hypothetical protein VaNZ11_005529 [Volvox africanus]|uniref:RBR-type E3 ubiquitin transferase n=1 Tax=Volvox africanus TaxID=51714 RepID=A0ABQ5S0F7_9CHLO|nr:hypothetical protein VaNZ11_005529 [Volvox africanus]
MDGENIELDKLTHKRRRPRRTLNAGNEPESSEDSDPLPLRNFVPLTTPPPRALPAAYFRRPELRAWRQGFRPVLRYVPSPALPMRQVIVIDDGEEPPALAGAGSTAHAVEEPQRMTGPGFVGGPDAALDGAPIAPATGPTDLVLGTVARKRVETIQTRRTILVKTNGKGAAVIGEGRSVAAGVAADADPSSQATECPSAAGASGTRLGSSAAVPSGGAGIPAALTSGLPTATLTAGAARMAAVAAPMVAPAAMAIEAPAAAEGGASAAGSVARPVDRQLTCGICLDEKPSHAFHTIESCRHQYCRDCLGRHVQLAAREKVFPVRCPQPHCRGTGVSVAEGLQLLDTAEDRDKLMMSEVESSLPQHLRFYCPNPLCSLLMMLDEAEPAENTPARCPGCHKPLCARCRVLWHSGLSCAQHRALQSRPGGGDEAALLGVAGEHGWKPCPQCRHMVELAHGCNHITCKCGAEWCYKCGAPWRRVQQPTLLPGPAGAFLRGRSVPTCSCQLWDDNNRRLEQEFRARFYARQGVPDDVARRRAVDEVADVGIMLRNLQRIQQRNAPNQEQTQHEQNQIPQLPVAAAGPGGDVDGRLGFERMYRNMRLGLGLEMPDPEAAQPNTNSDHRRADAGGGTAAAVEPAAEAANGEGNSGRVRSDRVLDVRSRAAEAALPLGLGLGPALFGPKGARLRGRRMHLQTQKQVRQDTQVSALAIMPLWVPRHAADGADDGKVEGEGKQAREGDASGGSGAAAAGGSAIRDSERKQNHHMAMQGLLRAALSGRATEVERGNRNAGAQGADRKAPGTRPHERIQELRTLLDNVFDDGDVKQLEEGRGGLEGRVPRRRTGSGEAPTWLLWRHPMPRAICKADTVDPVLGLPVLHGQHPHTQEGQAQQTQQPSQQTHQVRQQEPQQQPRAVLPVDPSLVEPLGRCVFRTISQGRDTVHGAGTTMGADKGTGNAHAQSKAEQIVKLGYIRPRPVLWQRLPTFGGLTFQAFAPRDSDGGSGGAAMASAVAAGPTPSAKRLRGLGETESQGGGTREASNAGLAPVSAAGPSLEPGQHQGRRPTDPAAKRRKAVYPPPGYRGAGGLNNPGRHAGGPSGNEGSDKSDDAAEGVAPFHSNNSLPQPITKRRARDRDNDLLGSFSRHLTALCGGAVCRRKAARAAAAPVGQTAPVVQNWNDGGRGGDGAFGHDGCNVAPPLMLQETLLAPMKRCWRTDEQRHKRRSVATGGVRGASAAAACSGPGADAGGDSQSKKRGLAGVSRKECVIERAQQHQKQPIIFPPMQTGSVCDGRTSMQGKLVNLRSRSGAKDSTHRRLRHFSCFSSSTSATSLSYSSDTEGIGNNYNGNAPDHAGDDTDEDDSGDDGWSSEDEVEQELGNRTSSEPFAAITAAPVPALAMAPPPALAYPDKFQRRLSESRSKPTVAGAAERTAQSPQLRGVAAVAHLPFRAPEAHDSRKGDLRARAIGQCAAPGGSAYGSGASQQQQRQEEEGESEAQRKRQGKGSALAAHDQPKLGLESSLKELSAIMLRMRDEGHWLQVREDLKSMAESAARDATEAVRARERQLQRDTVRGTAGLASGAEAAAAAASSAATASTAVWAMAIGNRGRANAGTMASGRLGSGADSDSKASKRHEGTSADERLAERRSFRAATEGTQAARTKVQVDGQVASWRLGPGPKGTDLLLLAECQLSGQKRKRSPGTASGPDQVKEQTGAALARTATAVREYTQTEVVKEAPAPGRGVNVDNRLSAAQPAAGSGRPEGRNLGSASGEQPREYTGSMRSLPAQAGNVSCRQPEEPLARGWGNDELSNGDMDGGRGRILLRNDLDQPLFLRHNFRMAREQQLRHQREQKQHRAGPAHGSSQITGTPHDPPFAGLDPSEVVTGPSPANEPGITLEEEIDANGRSTMPLGCEPSIMAGDLEAPRPFLETAASHPANDRPTYAIRSGFDNVSNLTTDILRLAGTEYPIGRNGSDSRSHGASQRTKVAAEATLTGHESVRCDQTQSPFAAAATAGKSLRDRYPCKSFGLRTSRRVGAETERDTDGIEVTRQPTSAPVCKTTEANSAMAEAAGGSRLRSAPAHRRGSRRQGAEGDSIPHPSCHALLPEDCAVQALGAVDAGNGIAVDETPPYTGDARGLRQMPGYAGSLRMNLIPDTMLSALGLGPGPVDDMAVRTAQPSGEERRSGSFTRCSRRRRHGGDCDIFPSSAAGGSGNAADRSSALRGNRGVMAVLGGPLDSMTLAKAPGRDVLDGGEEGIMILTAATTAASPPNDAGVAIALPVRAPGEGAQEAKLQLPIAALPGLLMGPHGRDGEVDAEDIPPADTVMAESGAIADGRPETTTAAKKPAGIIPGQLPGLLMAGGVGASNLTPVAEAAQVSGPPIVGLQILPAVMMQVPADVGGAVGARGPTAASAAVATTATGVATSSDQGPQVAPTPPPIVVQVVLQMIHQGNEPLLQETLEQIRQQLDSLLAGVRQQQRSGHVTEPPQ